MRGFFYFARGASSKFYPKFKICYADAERALHRRRFCCRISNFTPHLLLSMHRFPVLKSKISKFYPQIHDLRILCRDFRFYRGGKGPQLRSHTSRRGRAAPQHCIALLARKPHLAPYNAIWASCARVKFFLLRIRRMKFFRAKFYRIWNFKIPSVADKPIYPPINHQTAKPSADRQASSRPQTKLAASQTDRQPTD